MIAWADIKPTIASLIADISGLGAAGVRWTDEPASSGWQKNAAVFLTIRSITSQGVEEELRDAALNPADDDVVTVVGQRRFTLSIRAESFTQDLANPNFAGNVLSQIQIRLARTSSAERLYGLCAIEDYKPVIPMEVARQDRRVSVYVLDVLMRTADTDIDTTTDAGDWIGEALIVSNPLNGTDGQPLVEQISLDVVRPS